MKVSVLIPIYKVERFIERCATSLMQQTLDDVEFVFVDDASPDNSLKVLESVLTLYPSRRANVKILHHDVNNGLPSARNTALSVAEGEYIFHCDSDDWIEPTMLEELYCEAKENNADYVWCDWFLSFAESERYMSQPRYANTEDLLKGLLDGTLKFNVWNKLVKRELYVENNIWFPEGHAMGEDMTMIRLASCAKQVGYVKKAFYHYVKTNSNAYSYAMTEKHMSDIKYNLDLTASYLYAKFGNTLVEYISFFKLNTKLPFLITSNKEKYEIWKKWYPEANVYIWKNKRQPFRTRLLQWMADKGQWWYIRLYYYLVMKFVYGVIYK